jgi:hypothetical protein
MPTFLDTNIFLYAAGSDHGEKGACVQILRRVAEGTLEATTNTEVIQEILYVLIRRGRRQQAMALARQVLILCPKLLPVTGADMTEAFRLLGKHHGLAVRDAIHAATMIRNGLATVISADSHFDQIPEIRRLAPSAA